MAFIKNIFGWLGSSLRFPAPYFTFQHTVFINRPISLTAAFLLDPPHYQLWVPQLVSCTALSPDPFLTGTHLSEIFRFERRHEVLKTVVTSFQPLQKLSTTGIGEQIWMRKTLHFEPILNGTRIHYFEEMKRKGFKNYFTGHLKNARQREVNEKFNRIKKHLEDGARQHLQSPTTLQRPA